MLSVKDYVAIRADRRCNLQKLSHRKKSRRVKKDYECIAGTGKVELAVLKEEEWQVGVARN